MIHPQNSQRNIIIHCHIFKNAGSTFDWSLKRSFGNAFLDHRDDKNMLHGASYLGSFLQEHAGLSALSSHHVRFPLPALESTRLFPVFLLRHPIDRAGSVYAFERAQKSNTPGATHAKKLSFSEYVRWRMLPEVGPTIRNFQTRCCAGRFIKPHEKVTENDFENALETLSNTPFAGLVEIYDKSMVVFEEALSELFQECELSYIKQNVGHGRASDLSERIARVKEDLEPDALQLFEEKNQHDFRLYEFARGLLETRMSVIENFSGKLRHFYDRCESLSS